MESNIYTEEGKQKGKITLPEGVFGLPWNPDMVHQVVVSMSGNSRQGSAHTKDRSEVAGGGRKPWRQKGTGRARHGSIRSPIWIGGGVTFGPRNEKNYDRKINKKMKTKTLFTVLSRKNKDGEVLFIDDIESGDSKTKKGRTFLSTLSKIKGFEKLSYDKGKRAVIVTPEKDMNLYRIFRNIKTTSCEELRNINPLMLLTYKYVVFVKPKECVELLTKKSA